MSCICAHRSKRVHSVRVIERKSNFFNSNDGQSQGTKCPRVIDEWKKYCVFPWHSIHTIITFSFAKFSFYQQNSRSTDFQIKENKMCYFVKLLSTRNERDHKENVTPETQVFRF
jgi:hypothetical protein